MSGIPPRRSVIHLVVHLIHDEEGRRGGVQTKGHALEPPGILELTRHETRIGAEHEVRLDGPHALGAPAVHGAQPVSLMSQIIPEPSLLLQPLVSAIAHDLLARTILLRVFAKTVVAVTYLIAQSTESGYDHLVIQMTAVNHAGPRHIECVLEQPLVKYVLIERTRCISPLCGWPLLGGLSLTIDGQTRADLLGQSRHVVIVQVAEVTQPVFPGQARPLQYRRPGLAVVVLLVPRRAVLDIRMERPVLAIDKYRCTGAGKFLDQILIRDRGDITCGGVQVGILAAEPVPIEPWLPEVAYLLLLPPGDIRYRLLRPHRRHQCRRQHDPSPPGAAHYRRAHAVFLRLTAALASHRVRHRKNPPTLNLGAHFHLIKPGRTCGV